MCDLIVSKTAADKLSQMLIDNSLSLVSSVPSTRKKTSKKISYVKLPDDVKAARSMCKTAFGSWKNHDFPSVGDIHDTYRCLRKEYRLLMRNFLNNLENDNVTKLCNAAESDEKLFWKLLKGQRSSSQMSAFLVKDKLITDKNFIREIWVNHFEALGTPSNNENFDSNFLARVTASVEDIFKICSENPAGALCTPLEYEVARVCSNLKPEVSGISLDYEHILFAGPTLWNHLFLLYRDFFQTHTVPENLKTGVKLPLFKGKGAKVNNKDNYRGITIFPTLCKICEMILLSRLEVFAEQKGFFSEIQFGFQEGIGCIEASFTILETINHMLERGCKIFSCFLDVRKAFDTVWIDGLLYKLFIELYTDVKAQVLYSGSLSRQFKVSQGTGQGRILAPFMYKVYINVLLNTLTNYAYPIFINGLRVSSPSFADDISLLTTQQSFLAVLMHICYCYRLKWRYEFNNSKSGVVTFGETKAVHYQSMKTHE